jgi:hypothetical protein
MARALDSPLNACTALILSQHLRFPSLYSSRHHVKGQQLAGTIGKTLYRAGPDGTQSVPLPPTATAAGRDAEAAGRNACPCFQCMKNKRLRPARCMSRKLGLQWNTLSLREPGSCRCGGLKPSAFSVAWPTCRWRGLQPSTFSAGASQLHLGRAGPLNTQQHHKYTSTIKSPLSEAIIAPRATTGPTVGCMQHR